MLPSPLQQNSSSMGSLSHATFPMMGQPAPPWGRTEHRMIPLSLTPQKKEVSHSARCKLTSSIGRVLVCACLTCSAARHHALYKVALNHICTSFGDITKDPLPVSPFPS